MPILSITNGAQLIIYLIDGKTRNLGCRIGSTDV